MTLKTRKARLLRLAEDIATLGIIFVMTVFIMLLVLLVS